MLLYVLRRIGWSLLTVFGVMVLTFLLFRLSAGDIAAAHVGEKATERAKAVFLHKYGYHLPTLLNVHRRLVLTDATDGNRPLNVADAKGSNAAEALGLILETVEAPPPTEAGDDEPPPPAVVPRVLVGHYVPFLDDQTPLPALTRNAPLAPQAKAPAPKAGEEAATQSATAEPATQPGTAEPSTQPTTAQASSPPTTGEAAPRAIMVFRLSDGTELKVDFTGATTAGDVLEAVNRHPHNDGRLVASFSPRGPLTVFDSQFFHHLQRSVTFQARSLRDERKLTAIIAQHGPASLAVSVPALGIGWAMAIIVASLVAYYRGSWGDKIGVFLSVLGMAVPFLAFLILGQWITFHLAPARAYGTFYPSNVYVPVLIIALASLGGQVRFYRTIILDETNRDYVRTARAKGVPLPGILFKHVLKNCMLPILTNVIMTIPFLILGNLLVEQSFGIAGLGDLMISSIQSRDETIMNGLVFLLALVYTAGILVTDLSYTLFDPRVRLR